MINDVLIEKEKYLSKSKAVLLKEYINNPSRTVLQSKLPAINEIVRLKGLARR